VPVLAGAGGLAANWKGEPVGTSGGQLLIIGDQGLIPEVTSLLAEVANGSGD
jgi:hypothetical protein